MTMMMNGSIHMDFLRRIAVTGVCVAVGQRRGAVHTAGTARGDAQRAPQVRAATPWRDRGGDWRPDLCAEGGWRPLVWRYSTERGSAKQKSIHSPENIPSHTDMFRFKKRVNLKQKLVQIDNTLRTFITPPHRGPVVSTSIPYASNSGLSSPPGD